MPKPSTSSEYNDQIRNNFDNPKSPSQLKRSNARVCNFSMRKRTKSENGILESRVSTEIDSVSQLPVAAGGGVTNNEKLQEFVLLAELEAVKHHIKMRNKNRKDGSGGKEDEGDNRKNVGDDEIVTAMYNYVPTQEDELELRAGDKVRVLSHDWRDSGTEGWWVGERDSQIGVFPRNFVDSDNSWDVSKGDIDSSVQPPVTPRTPNENRGFELFLTANNNNKSFVANSTALDQSSDNQKQQQQDFSHLSRSSSTGFSAVSGSSGVRIIPSEEIEKLGFLGLGAFGMVYKGRWKNQDVAIKTFSWHSNEVHIYQEAGHLSCLVHRNIVRLFGLSVEAASNSLDNSNPAIQPPNIPPPECTSTSTTAHLALIMEYARGGALHRLLHQEPYCHIKLSPKTLLNMSRQIAAGMRYLHSEAHICHRDLKSSNVLIKEEIPETATDADIARCTLLITDFGMARRTAELVSQQSKLGTLAYAAPEVCKQQGGFTVKSDVWSYGVLLWELLTKEIPYRNLEQPHLLYKIAFTNHKLYIPEGIPSILVNLLRSCWEEDKSRRPDFTKIVRILNTAGSYKFLEIPPTDFHELQATWRDEIQMNENMEDKKTSNQTPHKKSCSKVSQKNVSKDNSESEASSDSNCESDGNIGRSKSHLKEQKEREIWRQQLEEAQYDLQRREEVMQQREEACDRAMGTMMMITVLAANQLGPSAGGGPLPPRHPPSQLSLASNYSPPPPVPPPRKKPFVGLFKFWSHHHHQPPSTPHGPGHPDQGPPSTSHPSVSHYGSPSDCSGNPNISHPSNLQHVVHISKGGLNFASPAFNFFPDSIKMRTWDPKSSHHKMTHQQCQRDRLKSTDEENGCCHTIPSTRHHQPIEMESPCFPPINYGPGYFVDTNATNTTTTSSSGGQHADSSSTTTNTTGGNGANSTSQLCASAPNLRKISLGNLPVFEFSSFRRPLYCDTDLAETASSADPPAISNCPSCYFKWLDHRKPVPCDRCAWNATTNNRSATLGGSSSNHISRNIYPYDSSHYIKSSKSHHPPHYRSGSNKKWSCMPSRPPSRKHSYDNLLKETGCAQEEDENSQRKTNSFNTTSTSSATASVGRGKDKTKSSKSVNKSSSSTVSGKKKKSKRHHSLQPSEHQRRARVASSEDQPINEETSVGDNGEWRRTDNAMWSMMRMLTAVVLPDRENKNSNKKSEEKKATNENRGHPKLSHHGMNAVTPTSVQGDTFFYLSHEEASSSYSPPPVRTKPNHLKSAVTNASASGNKKGNTTAHHNHFSHTPRSSSVSSLRSSWRRFYSLSSSIKRPSSNQNKPPPSTSSTNRYRRLTSASISNPIPISLPSAVSALAASPANPNQQNDGPTNQDLLDKNSNFFASWQPHLTSISSSCVSAHDSNNNENDNNAHNNNDRNDKKTSNNRSQAREVL